MDLRLSESDEAFRARLREWLARTLPALPAPPGRGDWPARRAVRHGLAATAVRRGLRRPELVHRLRRPGRGAERAAAVPRGDDAGRGALRRRQLRRHAPRRPDPHRRRHRRAEDRALAAHPPGRGGLVPMLLRARSRLRPRRAAHPRGARRGPLRRQWPEDLVLVRARGRVRGAAGPHRSRRAEAPGHLVAHPPDGPAGDRGATHRDPARLLGVLRGVPRRGARARRQPGRRRARRLAGHERHAVLRAGHGLRQRDGRRASARRGAARLRAQRRASGASSATSSRSSTPCGRSPSAT